MSDPHDEARKALARLIWRTSDMDREYADIVADAVIAAGWPPPVAVPAPPPSHSNAACAARPG